MFDWQLKGTLDPSMARLVLEVVHKGRRLATLDAQKVLGMRGIGFDTRQSRFV